MLSLIINQHSKYKFHTHYPLIRISQDLTNDMHEIISNCGESVCEKK